MYEVIEQNDGTFISKIVTSSGIIIDYHDKKIDAILRVISDALFYNHITLSRENIRFSKQGFSSRTKYLLTKEI